MTVLRFDNASHLPFACVAALGNFDGVHIGHRALLDKITALAADSPEGTASLVWTFSSHTRNLLEGMALPQICTQEQKIGLFQSSGVDAVVFDDFSRVRSFSPDEFIRQVLVEQLRCTAVVVGWDFRFGEGGTGDAGLLSEHLAIRGVEVHVIPPVLWQGEVISSSLIRSCLTRGDITRANAMLGRYFSLLLPVVGGRQIGRTLNAPTINQLFPPGQIIPAYGVYLSRCLVNGRYYGGVTNIGVKPTLDGGGPSAETHLLDFDGDLYGQTIEVGLIQRLRGERRFSSLEELKEQIQLDISTARSHFSHSPEAIHA